MTLMRGIAACPEKSVEEMTREWDQLAEERHRQITSGEDLSFRHVVAPSTLRLLEAANTSVVVDVGCGTGHFTVELARIAKRVIAIDPSGASIEVAKEVCRGHQNVRFVE